MIKIDRDIRSLSDFKRKTPTMLKQLEDTGQPVVLTVNGKAKVVVQDAASYQRMAEKIEFAETVQAIREGVESFKAGRIMSLEEFDSAMQQKHPILRGK
jgi:prevent-host-death family protein